tara:strand:- start:266 stop:844 length:579 start_codon:yes stop_codon:yes gene_type:complete
MNKKILIQLVILFIIFLSLFLIYLIYFKIEENVKIPKNLSQELEKELSIKEENSNIIKNIEYVSENKGNKYQIKSKEGQIDIDNPDLILMIDVYAVINLADSESIVITANFAEYNSQNYDTNFYENVLVNYIDNKIQANNLDLSFENDLASMSNNIIFTNPTTTMMADRLEIDLITKNSKIFMDDKKKKLRY